MAQKHRTTCNVIYLAALWEEMVDFTVLKDDWIVEVKTDWDTGKSQ